VNPTECRRIVDTVNHSRESDISTEIDCDNRRILFEADSKTFEMKWYDNTPKSDIEVALKEMCEVLSTDVSDEMTRVSLPTSARKHNKSSRRLISSPSPERESP